MGGSEECRGRLGGKVGAEGLPLLVAVGAGAEAAGDLDLVQVSGDSLLRLAIDFAETVEAVAAAKRHGVQKRAEQIAHHRTDRGDVSEVSRSDRSLSSPSAVSSLHDWNRALADERNRHQMGADAVRVVQSVAWEALRRADLNECDST